MQGTRRFSRKREAILGALRSTVHHPSAETIYAVLKPELPDLSLATVYRNLNLFRGEGLAIVVAVVAGQERFDGNTTPHAHFVCDLCGAVLDIDSAPCPVPPDFAEGTILSSETVFHGSCKCCESKRATASIK